MEKKVFETIYLCGLTVFELVHMNKSSCLNSTYFNSRSWINENLYRQYWTIHRFQSFSSPCKASQTVLRARKQGRSEPRGEGHQWSKFYPVFVCVLHSVALSVWQVTALLSCALSSTRCIHKHFSATLLLLLLLLHSPLAVHSATQYVWPFL